MASAIAWALSMLTSRTIPMWTTDSSDTRTAPTGMTRGAVPERFPAT